MMTFNKESEISVFSPDQCSMLFCSNSDIFTDSDDYNGSESSGLYEFMVQKYSDNPVSSVIEKEAYCFDTERFSKKLVDATILEAKTKLLKPNLDINILDIVRPLIDILIDRALNTECDSLIPESLQFTSSVSIRDKVGCDSSFWPKIAEFNIKLGQEQIEQYVNSWERSRDWMFCVEFLGFESEDCSNIFIYEVEWSKPTMSYPIPQATACVYFALEVYKMVPFYHDQSINVSYIFESSILIHKPGRIDFQEKRLQDIIDVKTKYFQKMTFSEIAEMYKTALNTDPTQTVESIIKHLCSLCATKKN